MVLNETVRGLANVVNRRGLRTAAVLFGLCLNYFCLNTVFSKGSGPGVGSMYVASFNDATSTRTRGLQHAAEWNRDSQERAVTEFQNAAQRYLALDLVADAIHCLDDAAKILEILGRSEAAVSVWKSAYKTALAAKLKSLALSMASHVAQAQIRNGAIAEGRQQLKDAQRMKTVIDDNVSRSDLLMAEAEYARYQRDFAGSITAFGQAVDLRRSLSDTKGTAEALLEQGFDYMLAREYEKALTVLELSKSEWSALGSQRGEALANTALGHVYSAISDYDTGLKSYRAAEKDFPLDVDSFNRAILYNGLSNVYEELNDLPISIDFNKRALKIFGEENNLHAQMRNLSRLGVLMHKAGKSHEGRMYLEQSLDLARKLGDEYSENLIKLMFGVLLSDIEENIAALNQLNSSLVYFTARNNIREMAQIEYRRGAIWFKFGDLRRAIASLDRSEAFHREVRDVLGVAESLFYRALANAQLGNYGQSLSDIETSIEITDRQLESIANSKVRRLFLSNIAERYDLYIRLQMRGLRENAGSGSMYALQLAERSRAQTMLENISLASLGFAADAAPETAKREADIRARLSLRSDKLTDLLSLGAEKPEIEKLDGEINELQHQLEEIKAELKQKSPVYSAIKDPPAFDLADFQANVLDEGSVLLEFSLGKEESYLWVVGKSEFEAYVLPSREEIESRVETLRGLVSDREPRPSEAIEVYQARVAESDARYRTVAAELSSMLLGQAADRLEGKRLIVVADGGLHYFPISALPMPNSGSDQPILMTNEVVYQPSAQTLSMLKKLRPASGQTARRDLLLFSDPVFSVNDERLSGVELAAANTDSSTGDSFRFVESLDSLGRLRGSATEAASILKILGSSNADSFDGFAATRERLLNTKLADYKVLHFATHGIANKVRPDLSGIVLSRFGENGQHQDEFVRLEDIYGMKLKADLVVLSACETGIGKELKGEGTMSLNNAFLQSGSRSVLASLWKVEDNATRELMAEFYSGIASGGLTPSAALRRAQMKLASMPQYSSPFYWAAFTLHGDGGSPLSLSSKPTWPYVVSVLAILAALALCARRRFRR